MDRPHTPQERIDQIVDIIQEGAQSFREIRNLLLEIPKNERSVGTAKNILNNMSEEALINLLLGVSPNYTNAAQTKGKQEGARLAIIVFNARLINDESVQDFFKELEAADPNGIEIDDNYDLASKSLATRIRHWFGKL